MVHGNGERGSTTSPWRDSSATNERLDQWFMCPGVLPRSFQYAPRAMFSTRHSGSRGTETSSQRCAARAISATVCSGSGTCSRTSIAAARSNSSSAKGRFSAFMTRYSRFGAVRLAHSACSAGSSRSMPTTRRSSPKRCAHWCVSTPSPQPTSSSDCGSASVKSSSSVPSKRAMRRRTTGFFEPYLSYVLPVTVPSRSTVTLLIARATFPSQRARLSSNDALSQLQCLPLLRALARACPGRRLLARGTRARLVVRRRHVELQLDAPHALEDALHHDPLTVEQVADDPQRGQHDGGVEQHSAEDQRLHVAGAVAAEIGDDEARERYERGEEGHRRQQHEDLQRLVLRVHAGDGHAVAPHVGRDRGEQARLARLWVGRDRDVLGGDQELAGLDDGLERVGVLGD